MRLFGAVLMIVMVGVMTGCGGAIAPLAASSASGVVVLADSVTQIQYSLSVLGGAAALTGTSGTGMAVSEPKLVDSVTGARYSLGVASGALTLVRGPSSAPGEIRIGLADTLTAKTYELSVVSGALTLTPHEGGAQ